MKRSFVTHALIALLALGGKAMADIFVGGTVDSNSATITSGCFTRSGLVFSWNVNGAASYTDGGLADDWRAKAATCTSTGGNLAAAWSNALTTCPAAWKTANGL